MATATQQRQSQRGQNQQRENLPARQSSGRGFQQVGQFQPYARPRSGFDLLQQQLDELFQSVLAPVGADGVWVPDVDIEETDDAWIIEAEVPGIDKKDLNVETRNNEIVISGEIKERERKGIIRRRTRKVGEFEFRAVLPNEADADNIDADVDNGVLTVRVPKQEREETRRIEVGSRGNGASAS